MGAVEANRKLDLKAGDWVIVRSADEILATLDAHAQFEYLPYMPQMLALCGKKFQVRKRAHKLCDTAFSTGGRQLNDAVFLDDVRCDGAAYGGCEMRCSIVWKEVWLKRTDETGGEDVPSTSAAVPQLESLVRAGTTRKAPNPSTEPLYVCQATELPRATRLLPWWEPRQYVEDYKSGNVALSDIIGRLVFLVYTVLVGTGLGFGSALRWLYNTFQHVRGGDPYPVRPGRLAVGGPTPSVDLQLREGDLVRIKSGDAILATVDENLVNRGMAFHPDMMPHCGKTFRVAQRVRKVINEKTGQLVELKNSCLALEGADCIGGCTRPLSCPRACPPYWREIWLERVETAANPLNTPSP